MAVWLKELCHGQKCLHLFLDSQAYHEQMGTIPSSHEAYIQPYPMCILRALGDALSDRRRNKIDLEIGN